MPKVSVIVPTYNRSHFVCDAIDSILNQTFKDFEVITVDDGSTDNTQGVLQKYGSRLYYIYQQNHGLPAARNTGIEAAKGEYIAFLDDDDLWFPEKLEKQVKFLDANPDIGLVHAFTEVVDERGLLLAEETKNRLKQYKKSMQLGYTYGGISRMGIMFMSSVMVRKSCLELVGYFDSTLDCGREDWDFALRFALKYRIATLLEPLVKYRLHQSSTLFKKLTEGRIKVCLKHLAMLDCMDNLGLRDRIRYNFYLHLTNAYYIDMQMKAFRACALKAFRLNPAAICSSRLGLHFLVSLLPLGCISMIRGLKDL
jgi:glycosyltransferase involved in cell wall biosynthesis